MQPVIQMSGMSDGMKYYAAAIEAAGGVPRVGYCPQPDLTCDGLLLGGGEDVDPARFGQENRGAYPPDLARDEAEFALLEAYWKAGKPILGICRGMQILNVFLGGDLVQDLPDEERPFHRRKEGYAVHPIRTAPGSLLHGWYGGIVQVNSSHHQVVDRPGRGAIVTAWSEAGRAEAIEVPGRPVMGVQFHPERPSFLKLRTEEEDSLAIFRWLLQQCK